MPLTATPSGTKPFSRADDVRSLRFRVKNVALAGTYAAGGDTVTAAELGLKQVYGGWPLTGSIVPTAAGTSAEDIGITVNAAKTVATIKLYEAAAAGSPHAENGAAAVDARDALLVFVGH